MRPRSHAAAADGVGVPPIHTASCAARRSSRSRSLAWDATHAVGLARLEHTALLPYRFPSAAAAAVVEGVEDLDQPHTMSLSSSSSLRDADLPPKRGRLELRPFFWSGGGINEAMVTTSASGGGGSAPALPLGGKRGGVEFSQNVGPSERAKIH